MSPSMALVPGTTAHVMDTAHQDVVTPHTHNAYENKVVNADIRIRSVKDESTLELIDGHEEEVVEQSQPGLENASDQERADEMRTWWNDAMKRHMNQPDGYAKASVLLIKWADELDELKTKAEVCFYSSTLMKRRVLTCARHKNLRPSSATASTIRPDSPSSMFAIKHSILWKDMSRISSVSMMAHTISS